MVLSAGDGEVETEAVCAFVVEMTASRGGALHLEAGSNRGCWRAMQRLSSRLWISRGVLYYPSRSGS